ncbi:serine hydrolase [Amycolatopsis cihanbeyliensis]|uniref:Beta-lactamase n=1 Tax=Amycolatopsis cihanbeyliensis TaxID=1128664 RepID=A0A542DGL1_AMYCI|nr:serine hydrolase [Amycolatopsis cihanbeyliensis]TQJ02171.1 beta-lactamase family protein [Amycolatopsis cihanbeyliensis]
MLTRRRLLTSAALAGSATLLLPSGVGTAAPAPTSTGTPRGWLDWIAAHRDSVGLVLDDGASGRVRHRPYAEQLLASTIKVVHLAAYATAAGRGLLDPRERVRVGDWELHHPYVGDGGAHLQALRWLGIETNELGHAADPEQRVELDRIVAAMIDFSDNAAADYLRVRLGDRALRAAAGAGGWYRPDLRSFQGEVLLLIFPEYAPPAGTPTLVRRMAGDRLARWFRVDPGFRERVLHRIPEMPRTPEEQWPWARQHGRGSAVELFRMHHTLAAGRFHPEPALPIVRDHLERALAGSVPPGGLGLGFKGGSLPRTLTMGMSLRWADGRTGTLALLLTDVAQERFADVPAFLRLGVSVLAEPDWRDRLARALRD